MQVMFSDVSLANVPTNIDWIGFQVENVTPDDVNRVTLVSLRPLASDERIRGRAFDVVVSREEAKVSDTSGKSFDQIQDEYNANVRQVALQKAYAKLTE